MTLYEQLVALLLNATDAADRIYPNVAADKPPRPYIVYTRISSASENVLEGPTSLVNTRVQIDLYADSYVAVQTLASQVDALMQGWALQNVSNPAVDQYEPDVLLHRVILDYSIWHT